MEWKSGGGLNTLEPDATTAVESYFGVDGRLANEAERGRHEPQAWQVRLAPSYGTLRVHFHPVNQFQLFTHGGGHFGRHTIHAGSSVHYADAFTPYGPLIPDAVDGVSFINLRAVHDMGAFYMPEERDVLREHPAEGTQRRNLSFELSEPLDAVGEWSDLINEDDGLRITVADVDSDGIAVPTAGGDGAYLVLLSGEVIDGEGRWTTGALAWCARTDEYPATLTTPSGIARIAFLQLPMSPPATM